MLAKAEFALNEVREKPAKSFKVPLNIVEVCFIQHVDNIIMSVLLTVKQLSCCNIQWPHSHLTL